MKILLLGSGGREHALAWKIAQSSKCGRLYIAPGNAGTDGIPLATAGRSKNVPLKVNDFEDIKAFCIDEGITMVVVGPEDPLVNGICDFFRNDDELKDIAVIGPTCVPQHSLQFLNACAEAGTQPDFFVYPGEGHNMAGHKSVHLHERITQYFEDYLK